MHKNQLVFISHSSNDHKIALALCDYLERGGLHCWIAPRDNGVGKDYADSIIEGINLSIIMIVILSKSSNNSGSVKSEVQIAVKKDIDLLPFRINNVSLSSSLEFFLSSKQWLDASNGNPKDYFSEVHRICTGLLNNDTVNVVTKPTQNKFETFVKSNKMVLLVSFILGFGILVFSFVSQSGKDGVIENRTLKDTIKNSFERGTEQADMTVDSSGQQNSKLTKENQKELVTINPIKDKDIEAKNEAISTSKSEPLDLDNVRFDNSKEDYIVFSKITKGNYNFNGSIAGLPFSGVAKFVMNSTYKISNSNTIKGQFSITENEISGGITLLEDDYTPTHFLLYKN